MLLQVLEDDAIIEELESPDPSEQVALSAELEHHLSFNALNGLVGIGTMTFRATLNGCNIHVLIDSGSSDNFLQPRITHCLKLPIEPIPPFKVLVGDDNVLVAEGLINELVVRIQGHSIHLSTYLLPVAGAAWFLV